MGFRLCESHEPSLQSLNYVKIMCHDTCEDMTDQRRYVHSLTSCESET